MRNVVGITPNSKPSESADVGIHAPLGSVTIHEKPMTSRETRAEPPAMANARSDNRLSKKASLNVLATAFDFSARLVVGLLLQPLLVSGLGDYLYGAWKVLGRMTGYISAAGGRPSQALKWTIATHQASSDFDEKRRRVATALVIWLICLPVLGLLGGLAAWFAPLFLKTPLELAWTVRLAAAIMIGQMILSSLTAIPRAVLRGENLEYKRMGLSTILVFVGGGLMALALYLNTGLVGVATAYLATTLLTGALFFQVARSHVSWLGLAKPSWKAIRWFFGLSWWFFVWRLLIHLILASDIIVLATLGSLEVVAAYSLAKYTTQTLITSVARTLGSVMPGLGRIIGAGDYKKGSRVRNEIMLLTWLITTVCGSMILLWNHDFVRLWVGPEYVQSSLATLLIIAMAIQLILIRTDAQIIDLTLKLRRKTIIGAISAAISLLLAGLFVAYFDAGIPGLCVGLMIGRLILSIGYPLISSRVLGVSLRAQVASSLRPALTTAVIFSVIWVIGGWLVARTWFALVAYVGITSVVVSLVALFIGLSVNQRELLFRRITKITASAPAG